MVARGPCLCGGKAAQANGKAEEEPSSQVWAHTNVNLRQGPILHTLRRVSRVRAASATTSAPRRPTVTAGNCRSSRLPHWLPSIVAVTAAGTASTSRALMPSMDSCRTQLGRLLATQRLVTPGCSVLQVTDLGTTIQEALSSRGGSPGPPRRDHAPVQERPVRHVGMLDEVVERLHVDVSVFPRFGRPAQDACPSLADERQHR